MRRKETISTGSFIGRDHLQTVNLALIALASSLDTGIQNRITSGAGPDVWECKCLESSGCTAEIVFQNAAQPFPAGEPAIDWTGFSFR